jgi:uncharacterized protein YndB with AHSA1/START domain
MNPSSNKSDQSTGKIELVITRSFDYPVEAVWKAWTDPQLVMQWWGPKNYTSPFCKIDFREGGQYLFCMRAPHEQGGLDYYSAGVYTKIIPMERLEFTQTLADKDGKMIDPSEVGMPADFPKEVNFVIEFKALAGKTELIITEYNWTLGQMSEYAVAGMNQSLDKIAAALPNMFK